MRIKVLVVLVWSLQLAAFAVQRHTVCKPSNHTPIPAFSTDGEPVLSFFSGGCYGKCPNYSLKVFADGRIDYDGGKYAKPHGKKHRKMDVALLQSLVVELRDRGFADLEDDYGSRCDLKTGVMQVHTDLYEVALRLHMTGYDKQVFHSPGYAEADAPSWLRDFEQKLVNACKLK